MDVMVYGSLKRGGHNHHWLGDARYIGEASVRGYRLYSLGSFPAAARSWLGPVIHGEVYRVTPEQLANLDRLEGVETHFYRRVQVTTVEGATVLMYVQLPLQVQGLKPVPGGRWPVGLVTRYEPESSNDELEESAQWA